MNEEEATPLLNLEAVGHRVNQAINDLGLERTAVLLSEGFCPLCHGRGSDIPVITKDDEPFDERPASAVVHCQPCALRWRTGMNGENGMDWIEHTQLVKDGMVLTMTINPPRDPPSEDDWWDVFDEDDDLL